MYWETCILLSVSGVGTATIVPTAADGKDNVNVMSIGLGIDAALERHIAWQRKLLERRPQEAQFLVLRPGDKLTLCRKGVQGCKRGASPSTSWFKAHRKHRHWDEVMEASSDGYSRPVSGLGNVALSLVSAAATALVSRRVLLIERWQVANHSFGPPLSHLILETSGWAPHVAAAQKNGSFIDWFAAHDDMSASEQLCSIHLRKESSVANTRLVRIFSNQYFLPLLLLNRHHAAAVERMAIQPTVSPRRMSGAPPSLFSNGLWGPAVRYLFKLREPLQRQVDAFVAAKLKGRRSLGVHLRSVPSEHQEQRDFECIQQRLAATNASVLLVATMHSHLRDKLARRLKSVEVVWMDGTEATQGVSTHHMDSAAIDLALLGRTDSLMLQKASTFGYLAHGLGGTPATSYGVGHVSIRMPSGCQDVPTTEPSFHFYGQALKQYRSCKLGSNKMLQSKPALDESTAVLLQLSSVSY